MAYITGTADDHHDLWDVLINFLTTNAALVAAGQNWAIEDQIIQATTREVYLKGPGLAGEDAIHVNMRYFEDLGANRYTWAVRGAGGYLSSATFSNQPVASGEVYIPLSNDTMKYWIVGNGRRFIVVHNIGIRYFASYQGFILPHFLPNEYTYPLFVSGNHTLASTTVANVENANFWQNATAAINKLLFYTGEWLEGNSGHNPSTSAYRFASWPWSYHKASTSAEGWAGGNINNEWSVVPNMLYAGYAGAGVLGELQGVYMIPGSGVNYDLQPEDTVSIGGVDYLALPDVYRITNSDFAAIKLE